MGGFRHDPKGRVEFDRAAAEARLKEDAERLHELDDLDADLDSTGASMLDSMMKQVEDEKRPLTEKQRGWVQDMIERLS